MQVVSVKNVVCIAIVLAAGALLIMPIAALGIASIGVGVLVGNLLAQGKQPPSVLADHKYQEVVSKSPLPFLMFNADGETFCANRAAEKLLDIEQSKLFSLQEKVPETRKLDLQACVQQGGLYTCLAKIDGQLIQLFLVGAPKSNLGFVYGIDVTKDRSSKLELEESQSFLRKVIDLDPNLIFVKDAGGRFTFVNEALAQVYNMSPKEMLGKKVSDFNPFADEIRTFAEEDREVLESKKEKLIEESRLTDGSGNVRYFTTVKRPLKVPDKDEYQVLGVAIEITERKSLQDQLLHAQKMEAIGQLAGGIAHDFNNLLSGVLGYASVLKFSNSDRPEVEEIADKIELAGLRAQKLTSQLLGFARGGKHQHVTVSLSETIDETIALVRRTIENDIDITVAPAEEELHTVGDPIQIQQVLLNLAINARDSMTPDKGGTDGGKLFVGMSKVEVDKQHERVGLQLSPGPYVELVVKDSGCGISESVQSKIFEPFFTTKGEGKGSGMGLAMVYGIIVSHDGAISVESTPNKGTTFYIYLPWSEPEGKTEIQSIASYLPTNRGKILVADDHKITREVTTRMLETLGYRVVTAHDGFEALDIYSANPSDIDLMILDLIMPRLNGLQCFRKCKEISPHVRAILMTGHSDNNAVQQSLNEGVIDFVQKPFRLHELSEVVSKSLALHQAA